MKPFHFFTQAITKDDRVEIIATMLGAFILGASFAKDFFLHGRFEVRIFFFGVSCLLLFISVSRIANIQIQVFHPEKRFLSIVWLLLICFGTYSALDLFNYQFVAIEPSHDLRLETILFLFCYTSSTNILYYLNRDNLFNSLRPKTVYKYLLAPINGISLGVIITGIIVWSLN